MRASRGGLRTVHFFHGLVLRRRWPETFPEEIKTLPNELYFEDLQPGMKFNSARSYKVTADEIKEFAERYDPQPFHLDESAGESSFFKGLAASGWLTAAIVMRLRVESIRVAGGMIGAGVEEMRWTQAVRPGDALRTEAEILTTRLSASRPAFGVVQSRTTVFNQRGEVVMRAVVNFLAPLRNPPATASRTV
jgi:acyl dehydratase